MFGEGRGGERGGSRGGGVGGWGDGWGVDVERREAGWGGEVRRVGGEVDVDVDGVLERREWGWGEVVVRYGMI